MAKKKKSALITGGAGFIGSFLAEDLLERGYKVYAVDNLSTGSLDNIEHLQANPNFTFEVGSIIDEELMEEMVIASDMIFHLAAAVGVKLIIEKPVDTIETNVLGTEIMLHLANKHDKSILITSTSEVYGKNEKVPFKENDDSVYGPTSKSRWSYACSKAVDEFLALAYYHEKKLPVVIVRLFNTIGPRQTGQYGMVVPTFVKQALLGHDITVYSDGKQTRCFTDVRDVTGSLIDLINNRKAYGEVFNIGNNIDISIVKLAETIRKMTGSGSKIIYVPYDKAYEKGFEDMRKRLPDISKAKSLIGFQPRIKLEETLVDIIEYYKK
ncbi:MAG: NAD-dependent epimerase/dehydratase family protein [candidate division Zixibacteria bacterium]|nr:NAD-dependent epimerase/dehydratase family protein [candidate division Zixibacteria bacterium]